MMGLSMTEIVIILGLALLLLGPDQLPGLAKSLGKGLRELRKRDDIPDACRLEMMNAMLEIVARHEIAAQERQER